MTELVTGERFPIESLSQRSGDLGDLYHHIENTQGFCQIVTARVHHSSGHYKNSGVKVTQYATYKLQLL